MSPWLLPAATQDVARPESKSSAKLKDSPGEQREEKAQNINAGAKLLVAI